MSLRLRLFLLVAGLAVLLVAGQALLVRSLAARLDRDVALVATRVGEQILSGFEFHTGDDAAGEAGRRLVLVGPRPPDAGAEGAEPGAAGGEGDAAPPRWVVRREWTETEERPGGFERRLEVKVVENTPPADAAGNDPPFVLEPAPNPDALVLSGPAHRRVIRIPRRPVVSTLDRFGSELAAGSLALLALGLVAAAVVVHRATRPLARLEAAARRLGAGELGVAVPVERRDEVGAALGAFNAMSARLAELDRENRRLVEAERLSELGEVARGLAHTLRNPLNALGLALDELGAGAPGERAAGLAESGRRQIRRVDGALRSFLALASADAAEPAALDVAALAREVALEALQDAGGRVRVEVEAPAPVPLEAVPAEVKAILQALLVNACEASPDGGRVRVAVARAGDGGAHVAVEDEGAGLAEEVRARLFAPHVTTKPHGSGMGLFLAQRLASGRYGGALALAPRPGGGTLATAALGARRTGERT